GPNGTQVVTQSEMRAVPAPRIDPLDPTGAGDALLGSVLADLDRAGAAIADVDASGIASAVVAAMPRVAAAISAVGGRGHLAKATLGGGPASGSPTLEDLRALDGGACVVCGSVAHSERRTARVGARSNVGRLEQRVTAATGATRTVEQARDWLADLRSTVVCGTGGSTAVAELVADLMNANGGVAFVRQPAEYLSIPIASERLLAISYSGTNKDINKVIRAAARLGVKRLGIVTINTAPPAADFGLLEGGVEVLSYGSQSSSRERGFVSIAATVAPAAIWVSAAYDRPSVLDSLVRPSEALRRFGDASAFIEDVARHSRSIEVFATGWARPAAVDFESKMTESATMPVRLHDVKDFSHGRFISVLDTDRPRLLMTVGEMTSYQSQLDTVLRSDSAPYLHLHFERPSGLGALDALVAVQHIATLTAGFAQRDLSRPAAIPSAGLDLYQWDGELP
ncbi:MAG: phosphoglycolate phosphatase, partial [Actinomycetia bacterium]|nr:phosphoglycolate phosphatase [Actinomycetes bacterium]